MVRKAIEQAHDECRRLSFVVSLLTAVGAVNGVAVPLDPGKRNGILTFCCAGPAKQLTRKRLINVLGPRLVKTVAAICEALLRTPLPCTEPRFGPDAVPRAGERTNTAENP